MQPMATPPAPVPARLPPNLSLGTLGPQPPSHASWLHLSPDQPAWHLHAPLVWSMPAGSDAAVELAREWQQALHERRPTLRLGRAEHRKQRDSGRVRIEQPLRPPADQPVVEYAGQDHTGQANTDISQLQDPTNR